MNREHRLAVYGSLAPGRPNHDQLAGLLGSWSSGVVHGRLLQAGWGSWIGYPGLAPDDQGPAVEVQVFESAELPDHWCRIDQFEGAAYQRVATTVDTDRGPVEAYVYALRADEGSCPERARQPRRQ